jgi:hypothetical protein
MRLLRRKSFWRALRRRLVAGLTLVAYLVAAVGFPLPAAARRPGGAPAPCQNQLCRCDTAQQGPRRCCCSAPQGRAATTGANASPPAARASQPDLRDRASGKATPAPPCPHCARSHAVQPKPAAARTDDKRDSPLGGTQGGWRWVCGVTGQCCQGLLTLWVSYRAVLAPAPAAGWQPSLGPSEWLADVAGSVSCLPLAPPDPPPRLSLPNP